MISAADDFENDLAKIHKISVNESYKYWIDLLQRRQYVDWLIGVKRRFQQFLTLYHGSQFTYSCISWFSHTSTPPNNLPKQLLLFHIYLAHWWKKNDACRIDFCQSLERKLAELGFEITTPGLTARIATDWATGAVFLENLSETFCLTFPYGG